MSRLLVTVSWALAMQMRVVIPAVQGSDPPDPPPPPKVKAKLDVTITLHFPAETRQVVVKKVLDGLEPLRVKETLVRVPEAGKGAYAEVVAAPGVRSQDVATVVRTLMDVGIKKIAIEVKK